MSSGVRFMGAALPAQLARSYQLAARSRSPQAASCKLQAASCKLSVEYKPEKTPQKIDSQKQQHRRPVDAAGFVRGEDAAERAHERVGHTGEDLVELHQDVVPGAVPPAEGGLRREENDPRNDDPREDHPQDHREDDVDDADERPEPVHYPRSPKMARPTRMIVAPSSIAVSKSSVMPIDSSSSPSRSRSARSSPKERRASSAGGMAMSPRRRSASSLRMVSASAPASAGAAPLFCGSLPMFTSMSTSCTFP